MIWIVFTICLVAMVGLFVGGLCHSAGMADDEIDRLEAIDWEGRQ